MCILLLQLNHPEFAFIAASNRDEFLKRPTAPSHWHSFPSPAEFEGKEASTPSLAFSKDGLVQKKGAEAASEAGRPSVQRPILSGIDVDPRGGGTWIGLSRTGKFAALTNFTELAPPPLPQGRGLSAYRSRGKLPKDWLLQECDRRGGASGSSKSVEGDLQDYLEGIAARMDEWPGFNLFAGHLLTKDRRAKIGYVSNRNQGVGVAYLPAQAQANGEETSSSVGIACPPPERDNAAKDLPGCASIGLSNSVLDAPWDKVTLGRQLLDEAIRAYDARKTSHGLDEEASEQRLANDLFDVLATTPDETPNDESFMTLVPRSVMVQPYCRDPKLGWYATRTATVILVRRPAKDANGQCPMQWWERDIHIVNQDNAVERCTSDNERHYTAILAPPS